MSGEVGSMCANDARGNTVTFWWVNRSSGSRTEVTFNVPDFSAASIADVRAKAMEIGYPGHNGGWWNYLVDDAHGWLAKRGWTKCKCHPKGATHG